MPTTSIVKLRARRGWEVAGSFSLGCFSMLLLGCSRSPAQPAVCAGSTSVAFGVVWPGIVDRIDAKDAAHKRQTFVRALARQPSNPRPALQLTWLAAEIGDMNLAVESARAALTLAGKEPRVRSLAAAALLARFIHSGGTTDLLDAGEFLALGSGDLATRCNRLLVLHRLGLRYRLAEGADDCPCLSALDLQLKPEARFPLDGRRHSTDQLSASELAEVEELLAEGDRKHAGAEMRLSGQAWRVWFELGALDLWRTASNEVGRRATEKRLAPLTRLYAEKNANPAPVDLWEQLAAVPPYASSTVREGLTHWREGSAALSRYEPDRVESELGPARRELASWLPALLPSIDLALAAARFHLGDDRGMLERSLAVRRNVSREAHPWAWARARWLEALALQARADWAESLRRAEEAGQIYAGLGETANSGYQNAIRGIALESQGAEEAASSAYLDAVTRIHQAGDTRLLAGALALFARQQSRAGRPHLAVDLQSESTILDSADATPQLVTEAKAVLAEQLFRAGANAQGKKVLQQAKEVAMHIESERPRRRAEAILAQVEASGVKEADPKAAEVALSRFLSEFGAFGERFFRIEALIDRAESRLLLGKRHGSEEDLAAALSEIASQSERLEDRVQSVTLLDRAREALDLLVEELLRSPGGANRAIGWIEWLRSEQIGLGFGSGERTLLLSNLKVAPHGSCITEYWAAPEELVAWTSCDGEAPRLNRVKLSRDKLLRALGELRKAAQGGNLDEIRLWSATASTWLVAPIGKALSESVSWTVIPDALFPAFPVAWLTLNGRFVFQDRVVEAAPSWAQLRSKPSSSVPWRGLGIGDPNPAPESLLQRLPFARAEVEQLPILFPGSSAKVGLDATWTSLLQKRGSFSLLHLATHVASGSHVPLSARLMLTPEPTRPEGRVSADEVARVRFPGLRLAVVASCSSATATPAKIAGSLDFANAFLSAGADEALGTLWDVSDRETSTAISEFYDGLKAGLNPKQALRKIWISGIEQQGGASSLSVRAALQLSSTIPQL